MWSDCHYIGHLTCQVCIFTFCIDETIALTAAAHGATTESLEIVMHNITLTEIEREQLNKREKEIHEKYLNALQGVNNAQGAYSHAVASGSGGFLSFLTGTSSDQVKLAEATSKALKEADEPLSERIPRFNGFSRQNDSIDYSHRVS